MSLVAQRTWPQVSKILKGKKFPIKDSLTEELLRSLTTKVFFSLTKKQIFSKYEGTIDLGLVQITPYESLRNDVRYLVSFPEIVGLKDVTFIWNGKFTANKKKTGFNMFVSEIENFNITANLDSFVSLEKQVIEKLNSLDNNPFTVQRSTNEEN